MLAEVDHINTSKRDSLLKDKVEASYSKLKDYCEKEGYKGWDPYDGLNSKVFQSIPFVRTNRFARLAWIQLFKRMPVNLRKLFLVPKGFNSKGLALFLSGYCKEFKIDPSEETRAIISYLCTWLMKNKSEGYSGACWGYNFDWQARAFFQPKNTPTVVATTYVASALLDAYEITGDEECLTVARSACNFVLKDLNRTHDNAAGFSFSYSPLDKTVVFNASLLGSRLLARVYSFTKEDLLLNEAKQSVNFCCQHQKVDGSWPYGTLPFHQWIDNFHTGFNLECIADYATYTGDHEYDEHLEKGFEYYVNTFFTKEGIAKYYNNALYPIDIHAPAQLVVTLSKLNRFVEHLDLVNTVLRWTIDNMQNEKGYFYYQVKKRFSSRIPYMRWAQSWMFNALATYLYEAKRLGESR